MKPVRVEVTTLILASMSLVFRKEALPFSEAQFLRPKSPALPSGRDTRAEDQRPPCPYAWGGGTTGDPSGLIGPCLAER